MSTSPPDSDLTQVGVIVHGENGARLVQALMTAGYAVHMVGTDDQLLNNLVISTGAHWYHDLSALRMALRGRPVIWSTGSLDADIRLVDHLYRWGVRDAIVIIDCLAAAFNVEGFIQFAARKLSDGQTPYGSYCVGLWRTRLGWSVFVGHPGKVARIASIVDAATPATS